MSFLRQFGPGLLVTAAFVGPGTITTAGKTGAQFGLALVWALLFSVIATTILQEMAARLGLATRMSLAQAMRESLPGAWMGKLAVVLVVAAIGLGNAAYEAGNISGAALALEQAMGTPISLNAILIGGLSAWLLAHKHYATVEKVLVGLVLFMSAMFIIAALWLLPDLSSLLPNAFSFSLPAGSTLLTIALIGTTVVPYNLFLHADAVQEKWSAQIPKHTAIKQARLDTALSIGLGGLITLAIMSTAAAAFFHSGVQYSHQSMPMQLQPLLGQHANWVFAAGLFASGLTSAITAPLAAAYAVTGALGWQHTMRATGFRAVWISVLLCGVIFAAIGTRPLSAIIFAQVANGMLLPVVAVFLLWVMTRRDILGDYVNGFWSTAAGSVVVLVTIGLSATRLLSLW